MLFLIIKKLKSRQTSYTTKPWLCLKERACERKKKAKLLPATILAGAFAGTLHEIDQSGSVCAYLCAGAAAGVRRSHNSTSPS